MQVESLEIEGPLLFTPQRFEDERGFLSETFRLDAVEQVFLGVRFVQENHTRSLRRGTLRGLHCQQPPREQGKLVRVPRGAILDVVVDARRGSPTFGRHLAVEISDANWRQLWVPPGFLHGFCTLQPETDVLYKVTNTYSPVHELSVAWDDAALQIAWPFRADELVISMKDRAAGSFGDLPALT